jgi:hypothetical protein
LLASNLLGCAMLYNSLLETSSNFSDPRSRCFNLVVIPGSFSQANKQLIAALQEDLQQYESDQAHLVTATKTLGDLQVC